MGPAGRTGQRQSQRRRADSAERHELAALRRENQRLRGDVEILKRATAFLAKETR
jgi:transposase